MLTIVLQHSFDNVHKLIDSTSNKADCYEFRLDTFNDLNKERLERAMLEIRSQKTIFTFRMKSQGGMFQKSFEERWKIFKTFFDLNPSYVDLEYDTPEIYLKELKSDYPKIRLILSYHDFEKTEKNLMELTKKVLLCKKADVYKLATKANHLTDALNMFALVRNLSKEISITGICMGEKGRLTRQLSPILGSTFNYVVNETGAESAPGQFDINELIEIYRYRSLNRDTKIFALLGNPVTQSPSHITHNRVLEELGENAVYIKIPIEAEEFSSFVSMAKELPFFGFSVTVPFKEIAKHVCEIVDNTAKAIGALNTLYKRNGFFHGTNTDGLGAIEALENHTDINEKKLIVLGAGGSARAIAFAGMKKGALVTILNRTASKARALKEEFGCEGFGFDEFDFKKLKKMDIIVNTTTVGMNDPSASPIDGKYLDKQTLVMDIVAKPRETKLLKLSIQNGCHVVYGYEMFVYQAVEQFQLFLDKHIDRKLVAQTIKNAYLSM